jgi:hypothetical protein
MVDLLVSFSLYIYGKQKPTQQKDLYSFRASVRNRSTSAEVPLWEMLKSKNFMEEESEDKQYWKLHC